MEHETDNGKSQLRDESIVVGPGEGRVLQTIGQVMEIKVGSEQTGGRFAFLESTLSPGMSDPPLHIHDNEDEALYILEGVVMVQLGARQIKATAGCFVYMPRGSAHAFCNPFEEAARVAGLITPAGFERYFEDISAYMSGLNGHRPDQAELMAIGVRYGGAVVGPPMLVEAEA